MRTKKRVGNKQYQSTLLVRSVRINGKPRHETLLNLSRWTEAQIEALEKGLKKREGSGDEREPFNLKEVNAKTEKGIGGGHGR